MYKTLALVIGLLVSASTIAGIEIDLVKEDFGNCTVRVTLDATPDSKIGTLVFRSFKIVDGIQYPCEIDQKIVEHSLGLAVSRYLSRPDIKPVTSIFVGKIAAFPWVRNAWKIKSQNGSYSPLSHQAFSQLVFKPWVSQPFSNALNNHGLD
jgi:hypothetical protein